jgi:hypothetical protein
MDSPGRSRGNGCLGEYLAACLGASDPAIVNKIIAQIVERLSKRPLEVPT